MEDITSQMDKLGFIFFGGKTKRFHTSDTLTSQTVAEHSFGVAWLCYMINPQAPRELILAALSHDLGEYLIGDVSSPVKRARPELKAILDDEEAKLLNHYGLDFELCDCDQRVLKLADYMDGMLFCIRERRMGSKYVQKIYENFYEYATQLKPQGNAASLIAAIDKKWKELNKC